MSIAFLAVALENIGFPATIADIHNTLYPHFVGHHIGLDVHDIESVSRDAPLQEGNVIALEVGLYIPNDARFPEKYRGIAIRIEDNVVVTREGCEVLSKDLPKGVEEIEALLPRVV